MLMLIWGWCVFTRLCRLYCCCLYIEDDISYCVQQGSSWKRERGGGGNKSSISLKRLDSINPSTVLLYFYWALIKIRKRATLRASARSFTADRCREFWKSSLTSNVDMSIVLSRHKPGSYSRHEKLAQSSGAICRRDQSANRKEE